VVLKGRAGDDAGPSQVKPGFKEIKEPLFPNKKKSPHPLKMPKYGFLNFFDKFLLF